MSYKIKLGTFSKLEKSTAQPTTTSWAEYDVTLKDGCDLLDPEVKLNISEATVANYNYATMFGKSFFITGKYMLRENLCVLQLRHDPMATYKSQIGSATLYVLRAASDSNGNIRDNFYPIKANSTKYHQVQSLNIPGDFDSGVVVVNCSGTATAGATTLLEFTATDFSTLVNKLYTDINGFQLTDVIQNVVKQFGGNPQALINGAMWFPFAFDVYQAENVKIGAWTSNVLGGVISDPLYTMADVEFTLNKHPLAASRGGYLNMSPYTQYVLGIPGAGVVELDTGKLMGQSKITIRRIMDAFSGQVITKVIAGSSNQLIAYMNGQIGVPIQLRGSNNVNNTITGSLSAATGIIGGAITANPVAVAGAATAGIGVALEARGGTGTSTSMGSGLAGIALEPIWLDTICYDITDADNAEHGRPLCANKQISTLSGFVQVSEGNVVIPGTITEQQEIKAILESGFFYE